jgi:hypothetical protein
MKTNPSNESKSQPETLQTTQLESPRATQTNSIQELTKALVKTQMELKGAKKDSENPFFKSKYSDLHSVWEAARDPLTKNGLCVIQTTEVQDQTLGIRTVLAHVSGEWISGFLPLSPVKFDPQGIGSAISYMRRYALAAIVGVYSEDDDAERATARPPIQQTAKTDKKTYHKDYDQQPPPFEPDLGWTKSNKY